MAIKQSASSLTQASVLTAAGTGEPAEPPEGEPVRPEPAIPTLPPQGVPLDGECGRHRLGLSVKSCRRQPLAGGHGQEALVFVSTNTSSIFPCGRFRPWCLASPGAGGALKAPSKGRLVSITISSSSVF